MALTGFLTILILLFVRFPARMDLEDVVPPEASAEAEMEHSS
jgi:hypothetical protein